MKLVRVTPNNLRAFWNNAPIELGTGVTLLFGKNNSGKSTLLDALGPASALGTHRGPENSPRENVVQNQVSSMMLELAVDPDELRAFVQSAPDFSLIGELAGNTPAEAQRYLEQMLSDALRIEVLMHSRGGRPPVLPSYVDQLCPRSKPLSFSQPERITVLKFRRNDHAEQHHEYIGSDAAVWPEMRVDDLSLLLYQHYKSRAFKLLAERRIAPLMTISFETDLAADAHNLVTVLHTLVSERGERLRLYESYVQRILPEIGEVLSIPTGKPGETQIKISMAEAKGRPDLAYGLNEVGTGAVQVLALVYAITMSKVPRLILLDEPSAYLHPGAARELMRLVAEFGQHQYVIATHMPFALDVFVAPRVILLDRKPEGTVRSQSIDPNAAAEQRLLLRALGSSLQDVFGADYVIWVEGPTESEVYRLAMQLTPGMPRGVVVLPIVHTGDLEVRERTTLAEIYQRLSTGGGLLPNSISFVLDLEARKGQDVKELQRRTGKRVFFTEGVRMIENLFLEPVLISTFLREVCADWPDGPAVRSSPEEVAAHWDGLQDPKRYAIDFARTVDPQRWRAEVHGGQVLEDTVMVLTDARLQYRKVEHGRRLAELCLAQSQSSLLEPVVRTLMAALDLRTDYIKMGVIDGARSTATPNSS